MKSSPLAQVKDRFKDKAGLVAAVRELATTDLWVDRVSEDKGWGSISNAKLLHLHDVLSQVKKDYGSRAKLIDAILESEKRSKDEGYRSRLEAWPTPRLLDALRPAPAPPKPKAAPKADAPAKEAAPKAKASAKGGAKAAKKAPAKKAAAKKAPAKKR
jgi:hypothetical protein